MEDEFIDIPGYAGYQINKSLQVRSIDRYVSNRWGNKSLIKGKVLKPYKHRSGYIYIQVGKSAKMHRLVALTFIPNPENKPFINHINADPTDYRIENLEWCTAKENARHASKLGRMKGIKGEANKMWGKRGDKSVHYGLTRGKNYAAKLVLDINTGIYYDCAADAADAKGHNLAILRHRLTGVLKNKTGLIYA